MRNIIFIICLYVFVSCQNKNSFQIEFEKTGATNTIIKSIIVDTIEIDKVLCSYSGISKIVNDQILFIDERFCWVFIFDKEGKLVDKKLGKGRGNKELNTGFIDEYLPLKSNKHLFIGSGMDCHIYNSDWEIEDRYHMSLVKSDSDVNHSNVYRNKNKYTLQWEKLNSRSNDQYAFIPVYVDSNQQNPYMLTKEYYTDMKVLAKMNLETGDVEEMIGSFSPIYLENKYIPQQAFLSFDINSKNELLISYHADSLIYITDDSFHIKKAFGRAGSDMDINYKKIKNLKQFLPAFKNSMVQDTYYRHLEYIEERNLLFRSYSKGKNKFCDGLQIFKDDLLIGDINVPKKLDIIGYIEPFFYSNIIIDEESEKMIIYRFKIEQI
jgi:hypothetical protein